METRIGILPIEDHTWANCSPRMIFNWFPYVHKFFSEFGSRPFFWYY